MWRFLTSNLRSRLVCHSVIPPPQMAGWQNRRLCLIQEVRSVNWMNVMRAAALLFTDVSKSSSGIAKHTCTLRISPSSSLLSFAALSVSSGTRGTNQQRRDSSQCSRTQAGHLYCGCWVSYRAGHPYIMLSSRPTCPTEKTSLSGTRRLAWPIRPETPRRSSPNGRIGCSSF